MNFRSLETLIWVARLGAMTAAAQHLNITQPAATRRIRELERTLGVKLFERTGHRLRLTDKGQVCLEHAERVIAFERALLNVAADPLQLRGHYRIGVGEVIAMTWLPAMVTALSSRFPQLSFEFSVDLSDNLVAGLDSGELALALLSPLVRHPRMRWIYLGNVALSWYASPKLGLDDRPIKPSDIGKLPIVTMPKDTSIAKVMRKWLAADSVVLHNKIHVCNSLSTVVALACAGIGACLLPLGLFSSKELEQRQLTSLSCDPAVPAMDFWIGYPTTTNQLFVSAIEAFALRFSADSLSATDPESQGGRSDDR